MKLIKVRTPRRGRSKSICIPTHQIGNNNFPIGRLNNYDSGLKRYTGSLSLVGELECISEMDKGSASEDHKS